MPLLFLRKTFLFLSPCLTLWSLSSLHHDHTHLFGLCDIIAAVIPFGHFSIQLAFLLVEYLHLFSYFAFSSCGSCAMMACVGYRKGMTNDDKEHRQSQLCLPLTANPGPDKAGRPSHHSGKYLSQPQEGKSTDPVRSPKFPCPHSLYKNNQDPKGHARWQ